MKLHEKFEQKLEIPFPLVSDEEQGAVEAFGVWQLKNSWVKSSWVLCEPPS